MRGEEFPGEEDTPTQASYQQWCEGYSSAPGIWSETGSLEGEDYKDGGRNEEEGAQKIQLSPGATNRLLHHTLLRPSEQKQHHSNNTNRTTTKSQQ